MGEKRDLRQRRRGRRACSNSPLDGVESTGRWTMPCPTFPKLWKQNSYLHFSIRLLTTGACHETFLYSLVYTSIITIQFITFDERPPDRIRIIFCPSTHLTNSSFCFLLLLVCLSVLASHIQFIHIEQSKIINLMPTTTTEETTRHSISIQIAWVESSWQPIL